MPESKELTTDASSPPSLLSRLLRSKKLVVAGAATIFSVSAKVFDIGAKILDWAQRYEFARDPDRWPIKLLLWFLTPTGQSALLIIAVTILILVIIWVVNAPPRDAQQSLISTDDQHAGEGQDEVKTLREANEQLLRDKQQAESELNEVKLAWAKTKPDTQIIQVPSIVPCGDSRLHQVAQTHRERIRRFVNITAIDPKEQKVIKGVPYVEFQFIIFNSSVFDISVDDQIEGRITWREGRHEDELHEFKKLKDNNAKNVPSMGEGNFTIYQRLTEQEAQHFWESNEVWFKFDELTITFRGSNEADQIHQTPLDTNNKPTGVRTRWLYFEPEAAIAYGSLPFIKEKRDIRVIHDELLKLQKETQWLIDIARLQAATIYRLVLLTTVQIGKHELLREHPYIEFEFTVENRSLYDITFDDLEGTIGFAGRELTYHPTWQKRTAIAHGDSGSVVIREKLTSGDVTKILNGRPSDTFDFRRLGIKVSGNHDLQSSALRLLHLTLKNEKLITVYPKLGIEIEDAIYDWAIDSRTGPRNSVREPLYITLILKVTNFRPVSITLETIKLSLSFNIKRHTAFATSAVYTRIYTTEQGVQVGEGESTQNLKQTPSRSLAEGESTKGTLQFVFEEIDLLETIEDSIKHPNSLNDTQVTLHVIDQNGEKHYEHAKLRHREMFEGL